MMRKILSILVIVLFFSSVNLTYAQELSLAFINLKEILDKYERVKVEAPNKKEAVAK